MITSFFKPKKSRKDSCKTKTSHGTMAPFPASSSTRSTTSTTDDGSSSPASSNSRSNSTTSTASSGNVVSGHHAGIKRGREEPRDEAALDDDDNNTDTAAHTRSAAGGADGAPGPPPTAASSDVKRRKEEENSKASSSVSDPVLELVSVLDDHDHQHPDDNDQCNEDGRTSWTWKAQLLHGCFRSPAFAKLASFVATERASHTVYPSSIHTFAALNLCPLHQVKVVIVGQDPYHGPGQAHGLSFSVEKGQAIPPSLRNVYKELRNDPWIGPTFRTPSHGCLRRWTDQGVLLLNACLTVRKGQPNSHAKKGWEMVTDHVLRAIDRHSRHFGRGVVFLLWGKPATAKAQGVLLLSTTTSRGSNNSTKNRPHQHTILCTSHPSPLGATKTNQPFLGSRCFSRCNQALVEMGMDPIDWNVD